MDKKNLNLEQNGSQWVLMVEEILKPGDEPGAPLQTRIEGRVERALQAILSGLELNQEFVAELQQAVLRSGKGLAESERVGERITLRILASSQAIVMADPKSGDVNRTALPTRVETAEPAQGWGFFLLERTAPGVDPDHDRRLSIIECYVYREGE